MVKLELPPRPTTPILPIHLILNLDVQVRTFGIEQKIYDDNNDVTQMDLNNVHVQSGTGLYRGTKLDLRTTAFDLKHDGLPIFRRQFAGLNPLHLTLTRTFSSLTNTSL